MGKVEMGHLLLRYLSSEVIAISSEALLSRKWLDNAL